MQAINERKRTFLEKKEWMTIPWSKHPETKTPGHEVLDVLCPVPGLLEDFHRLEGAGFEVVELKEKCVPLWQKTKELLTKLFRWRWQWEAASGGPVAHEVLVDPKISWTVDEDLKPLFPTVLYFKSLANADELSGYNAAVAILISCGHLFNLGTSPLAEMAYSSLPLDEMPEKINPLTMPHGGNLVYLDGVKESMRSVDYYLLEKHRSQGSWSLLWPLRTR